MPVVQATTSTMAGVYLLDLQFSDDIFRSAKETKEWNF